MNMMDWLFGAEPFGGEQSKNPFRNKHGEAYKVTRVRVESLHASHAELTM